MKMGSSLVKATGDSSIVGCMFVVCFVVVLECFTFVDRVIYEQDGDSTCTFSPLRVLFVRRHHRSFSRIPVSVARLSTSFQIVEPKHSFVVVSALVGKISGEIGPIEKLL